MTKEEQDKLAKSAREALNDSWGIVRRLLNEVTPNRIFSIDFLVVFAAIKLLNIETIAATLIEHIPANLSFAATPSEGDAESTGDVTRAVEDHAAIAKTLALALRIGLILVFLFRLGVMPIRGSKSLRNALARAMHITPSSEGHKGQDGQTGGPEGRAHRKKPFDENDKLQSVSEAVATQTEVIFRETQILRRLKAQEKRLKDAEMRKTILFKSVRNAGIFSKENFELSPIIEAENFAENRAKEIMKIVNSKEAREPEDQPVATLFSGNGCASEVEGKITVPAKPDENATGRTGHEIRKRFDLQLSVIEFDVDVHTFTDSNEERHYGDTSHIGPEKCQYTWNALANILCLHGGHAIPMNRLETILSGKPFTREMMVRCIDKFSRSYAPVYKHMALNIISNATVISVDDGHTRTNQTTAVAKKMEALRIALATKADSGTQKPYSQEDSSKEKMPELSKFFILPWGKANSLVERIGKFLHTYPHNAFSFMDKNAEGKDTIDVTLGKLSLQTTVITCVDRTLFGKKNEFLSIGMDTPVSYLDQSRIVFYRSDFRSSGYLLGEILAHRTESAGNNLTIQGDLSCENNVKLPTPKATKDDAQKNTEPLPPPAESSLEIIYAGCAAHARRPFKRFWKEDPELCESMLNYFKDLSISEQIIHRTKLTPTEVIDFRNRMEKPVWSAIMYISWMYLDKWSSKTSLGQALRYVLRGSDKLVRYIDNHELTWTNNFCENALRFESLNDSSSFGCDTYEGRVRLDILRTAYASAMATRIDPKLYMTFISIAAEEENIREQPENFTPGAFQRWQKTEVVSGTACPCCGTTYRELTKVTPNQGITTCVADCANSYAKRAIAVMAQRF